jgi:hypothetical protein
MWTLQGTGAVCSVLGHETDMPKYLRDVRCWVNSGKHLLALSFSGFDPKQTSNVLIKETILEHGLVGAPALIE